MKLVGLLITAAVVIGSSGQAFAQQGTTSPANQSVVNPTSDTPRSWVVSGFLGSNFGSSTNNNELDLNFDELGNNKSTSANFGGQLAYLGRGVIGGEFLADFSPGFEMNNVLFDRSPSLNSYMFNLIAVAPFGHARSSDPYISGGIGRVTLSSTIFTADPRLNPLVTTNQTTPATAEINGGTFGWDLGGGIMAWSERNWGFRGDVRYYRTSSSQTEFPDLENIGDGAAFSKALLTDISFWKVNAGIGFRW